MQYSWEGYCLDSFPYDRISDLLKLGAIAEDKIKIVEMVIFVFDTVENIVDRRRYWLAAFSPIPTMFSKGFIPTGLSKVGMVW